MDRAVLGLILEPRGEKPLAGSPRRGWEEFKGTFIRKGRCQTCRGGEFQEFERAGAVGRACIVHPVSRQHGKSPPLDVIFSIIRRGKVSPGVHLDTNSSGWFSAAVAAEFFG